MIRPRFTLKMEGGSQASFTFTDDRGVAINLGTLNIRRVAFDYLIDLIGRGEADAKAEFTIENIQEVFYADQEVF